MDHVETQVLHGVSELFPEAFSTLAAHCERHRQFLDDTSSAFDREIQFYRAYLEHIERYRSAGVPFCYPAVSAESREVAAVETFDLALAKRLLDERSAIVCNDFRLTELERTFVVTGPNQGGKTTFARTFGQLHHLARVGCPVPGAVVRVPLCDQIFTHFEREEELADLSGKLAMDLRRIRNILAEATERSVVVMNESFSSTTLADASFLGTRALERLVELDPCAWS